MNKTNTIEQPELFFCLVAPIGTDLETICDTINSQLQQFGYDTEIVKVTDMLYALDRDLSKSFPTTKERYNTLINTANSWRDLFNDDSIMAKLTFFLIRDIRAQRSGDPIKKARPVAYIIRQLKREEEIRLFREIYRQQVFQISAYADPEIRRLRLATQLRDGDSRKTRTDDFESDAGQLLQRDENEAYVDHGQRIRDVFPLADVFIDTTDIAVAKTTLIRFLKLLFGYNFHSPTREEYGMYIAETASWRSLDLSRQVGAAIFSENGEVKTLGCNEVPKPMGGTYWEDDKGDSREYLSKMDTNEDFKYRILADTLKHLADAGVVDNCYAEMKTRDFVKHVRDTKAIKLDKELLMMDIIEYGRIIHAEMNAITDAARLGTPINNTTLYCTTFPCHLCAKHIISSGISKVVYIEPYPKSYAKELYRGDILLKRAPENLDGKLYFEPFIGVAPNRYRDFFEKGKRKGGDGRAKDWQKDRPIPIITVTGREYIDSEDAHLKSLIQQFADKRVILSNPLLTGAGDEVSLGKHDSDSLNVSEAANTLEHDTENPGR